MSSENIYDLPLWYAIHTHPKQEERANENLRSWNVETFAPRMKRAVRQPFTDKIVYRPASLFPGYIFARFEFDKMHSKIRYTRGVHSVVRFNSKPAPVDDSIIDFMKSRVGEDGLINIGEEFEYGDQVIIQAGPFANFIGIFQRVMHASERVMLLLDTINYQPLVVIEKEFVRKYVAGAAA